MRERARVMLVYFLTGLNPYTGWAGRAEFAYALRDALQLTLGAVTYHPIEIMGGSLWLRAP